MDPSEFTVNLDQLRSIEELKDAQKGIRAEIRALEDEHKGLPLPPEPKAKYAAAKRTDDEINRRVKELEVREAYIRSLDEKGQSERVDEDFFRAERSSSKERDIFDLTTVRSRWGDPESASQELYDRARRAVEISVFPGKDRVRSQEHVFELFETTGARDALASHILLTGGPVYKRAFGKSLTGLPLTSAEQFAMTGVRALSLGTTGIPIPYVLDPTVIPVSNSVVNPLRAISSVDQIVGANEWRGVTAAAITAARAAEGTEASDNTPTLAQPTIVCSRVQAFVPFSIEAEADWAALEANMGRLFADAKDDEEATAFNTGNGTPPNPFGVVTGSTNTVAASTGLTITAANLYSLEAALPPRFRPRAQFVANRAMYNIIRALDTAGGAQLWLRIGELIGNAPASSGGNGNTGLRLLGYAVNELSTMPSTVTNATKIMLLGDFSYFKIIDRVGMTVEVIPHLFGGTNRFPTGQRGLFAYWRNGSKVVDAAAFRALTGTT